MNETKKETAFKDLEWKSFKTALKGILIIVFILLTSILIFSMITPKSNAITQDTDYTFENDVFVNINDSNYGKSIFFPEFNVRNITTINQDNYTGTYDFLSETIGTTSDTIDFIDTDNSGGGCTSEIIASYNGHNNILELDDSSNPNFIDVRNTLSNQVSGTVELWWATNDATDQMRIITWDGGSPVIHFGIRNGFWYYYTSGETNIIEAYDDYWYHIRIDFESGGGTYEGLAPDTYNVYINGIKYGAFDYQTVCTDMESFSFTSLASDSFYITYIDAIGYSWNDYNIGQNIANLNTSTLSIREVDKYEFSFDVFPFQYPIGYDNPSGWSDIESGGDDDTNIVNSINQWDREVYMENLALDNDDTGLEKEFDIESGILNITWKVNFTDWSGLTRFHTNIFSIDDTLISNIRVRTENLYYYDGTNEIYLDTLTTTNIYYEFNLFINAEYGISILSYTKNETYQDYFIIPLIVYNKLGLGKIEFRVVDSVGDMKCFLDNVGVYINGTSITNELGYVRTNFLSVFPIESINCNNHNLFEFYYNGTARFLISELMYLPIISTMWNLTDLTNFTGSHFNNVYDNVGQVLDYPTIWIEFYDNLSYTNGSLYGVKMIEGINEYFPSYTYLDVNKNENYFYVSGNRLNFRVDFNSSSYEGMSATFTIPEIPTKNGTIGFNNFYEGHIPPYFCINYTYSDINYYQFKNYPNRLNYILPQNQYLYQFIVNVSDYVVNQDNYTNHNSGFISGYISEIELGFLPNIDYTITTMIFINGMIPLIVMLVPTMALYNRFGKKMILPIMFLMSIICLVAQLIPVWLFSIMVLIYAYLGYIERSEGDL